jgi:hypothetical protein
MTTRLTDTAWLRIERVALSAALLTSTAFVAYVWAILITIGG